MKKFMLGLSMLLTTTCIVAQEQEKAKTPSNPPKPAPSAKTTSAPTQESGKPGTENKNNAVIFKGAGRKETGRDAAKEKNTKTTNAATQRDRPKDIPN
jgi:hypothetical protein